MGIVTASHTVGDFSPASAAVKYSLVAVVVIGSPSSGSSGGKKRCQNRPMMRGWPLCLRRITNSPSCWSVVMARHRSFLAVRYGKFPPGYICMSLMKSSLFH
jgi:hypothetical protein